jgi:hypothetical protein
MAGTKEGGLKAKAKNYELHGSDFYARIGAMGGRNGHTGGFAANPELAKIAGKKGGANGKRKGMTEQTKALIETAKKLNSEGKTLTQIAKAIGRSKSRVMAYLKTEVR